METVLQYIAVVAIVIGAVVWVVVRIVRLKRKGNQDSCCGCALADCCRKKDNREKKKCPENENSKDLE